MFRDVTLSDGTFSDVTLSDGTFSAVTLIDGTFCDGMFFHVGHFVMLH